MDFVFFFTAKLSLSMFEAFRLSVMSSYFVRFKSSFRYDMIVVLKKCYSAQQWCADIELVMEAIPVLWLDASISINCLFQCQINGVSWKTFCYSVDTKHTILIFLKTFRMCFFLCDQTAVILHCQASMI